MRKFEFHNIPSELQQINRWVVWRDTDGAKVPFSPYTQYNCDPLDSKNWLSFVLACDAAQHFGCGIGLVFDGSDGLVFIDFDNKSQNPDIAAMHAQAIERFDTYTEYSPSGLGFHLIAYGVKPDDVSLPLGVEIYDRDRFATFTGWTCNGAELRQAQWLLDLLPRKGQSGHINLGEAGAATSTLDRLSADKALQEECAKVREAPEGTRNNTLNNAAFALGTFVGAGTLDATAVAHALLAASVECGLSDAEAKKTIESGLNSGIRRPRESLSTGPNVPVGLPSVADLQLAAMSPERRLVEEAPKLSIMDESTVDGLLQITAGHTFETIPAPGEPFRLMPLPGVMGQIEAFLLAQSDMPHETAAHLGALAWFAGVTGLTYGLRDDGQNLYTILAAPTSTGKTATLSGLNTLNNFVENGHPLERDNLIKFAAMRDFVFPGHVTAPQSLMKVLQKSFSGYMFVDEVHRQLASMLSPRATDLERGKQQLLMTLYDGAKRYARIEGTQYSKNENNIEALGPRGFTYVGMTTPTKLKSVINEEDVKSGFLNRYIIINGVGGGVYNHEPNRIPSVDLVQQARQCALWCSAANAKGHRVPVNITDDAEAYRRAVADEAMLLGKRLGEAYEGLFGRLIRQSVRIASLIATADNPGSPMITIHMLRYAVGFVSDGLWSVLRWFIKGETGHVEGNVAKQTDVLIDIIRIFMRMDEKTLKTYGLNLNMTRKGIFTRRSVAFKTRMNAAFYHDRNGPAIALDRALEDLIKDGIIERLETDRRGKQSFRLI